MGMRPFIGLIEARLVIDLLLIFLGSLGLRHALDTSVLAVLKKGGEMSVRAYRVNKIDHECGDTFNLWHDDKLVEFLDRECGFYESLSDGTGLVEVPIEALEQALERVEMDEELKGAIRRDIEACRDQSYITYYCY